MTQNEPKNHPEGTERASSPSHPYRALVPYPYATREAELDIVDVGASIWRRWKLMLVVFLVVFGAGLALAFGYPATYRYSAVVKLGTIKALKGGQPFVMPITIATQLEQIYIPQALNDVANAGAHRARNLSIDVKTDKQSDTVALTVAAGRADGEIVEDLLKRISTQSTAAINRKISNYVSREQQYLQKEIDLISAREKSLDTQASTLSGAGAAAAASYVATQTAQLSMQKAALRQQLEVTLPGDIEHAGLVGKVTRSAQPTSLSHWAIAILSAVIAVLFALMAAVLVNYAAAVRHRLGGSA